MYGCVMFMPIVINNKEVSFAKGKNGMNAILIDRENNTFQVYTETRRYKPTPIPLDSVFSERGYSIKDWNIRALGSSTVMYVKITNVKRDLVISYSHKEMLEKAYDDNYKIPLYVKRILTYISNKLIDNVSEPVNLLLTAKHRLIDSVFTLAIPCPKHKDYISVDRCKFCKHHIKLIHDKIPKVVCKLG